LKLKKFSIPLVQFDFGSFDTDRVVSRFDTPTGSIRIDLGEFSAKKEDL
jgi:hypothetical protein